MTRAVCEAEPAEAVIAFVHMQRERGVRCSTNTVNSKLRSGYMAEWHELRVSEIPVPLPVGGEKSNKRKIFYQHKSKKI